MLQIRCSGASLGQLQGAIAGCEERDALATTNRNEDGEEARREVSVLGKVNGGLAFTQRLGVEQRAASLARVYSENLS